MFPIIGVLLQVLSVSFPSGESLLIGMIVSLAAFASATSLVLHRACRKLAKYDQVEIERLDKKAEAHQCEQEDWGRAHRELALLLTRIRDLLNTLCETDNQDTHEWCLEEVHKECEGLFIEAHALYKVLSQYELDLEEHLNGDVINVVFYQDWVGALYERYNQWWERQQTIDELEKLEARLQRLEQMLCRVHGTKGSWLDLPPFGVSSEPKTYQDVYEASAIKREEIHSRIWRLKEKQESSLTIKDERTSVESLERVHEQLDGEAKLSDLFLIEGMREEAVRTFKSVITDSNTIWMAETVEDMVLDELQKYLEMFNKTRRLYLEKGNCSQKAAIGYYAAALNHWTTAQALMLVLREKMDPVEDFEDETTLARVIYGFDLAFQWRTQQDLPDFARAIQKFYESLEDSCECSSSEIDLLL